MTSSGAFSLLCRNVFSSMHFHGQSLKNGAISLLFTSKQKPLVMRRDILRAPFSSLHEHQSDRYHTRSVQVDEKGKICDIVWKDGLLTEFHSIWLRHNCHCGQCRHENGQKLMIPSKVSADIKIQDLSVEDDCLHINWNKEENHMGMVPLKFMRDHNYNEETLNKQRGIVKTVPPLSIPTVQYEDIRTSVDEYVRWLQQINEDGLSIVKDVPLEDDMVKNVAELIAPVWTSIYGDVFDVISLPNPANIAYSSHHLDFHMDLVYFHSPPGLQFLHCLKFDDCVQGGINHFLDVFAVAEEFRISHPDLFHVLTTIPATFQKVHYERELPVHIVNQKPHIKLNHKGDIVAIYWAPGFEGPLSVVGKDVETYYRAYEKFAKAINESPLHLTYRLRPKDLIVFNNLRILHGRSDFELNGGSRHLKGCYVNIDMFKSKVQVSNILHGDGRLTKRVGNECWY